MGSTMKAAVLFVALALAVTGIWAVTEVQELGNDDSTSGGSVSLDADDSAEYDDMGKVWVAVALPSSPPVVRSHCPRGPMLPEVLVKKTNSAKVWADVALPSSRPVVRSRCLRGPMLLEEWVRRTNFKKHSTPSIPLCQRCSFTEVADTLRHFAAIFGCGEGM